MGEGEEHAHGPRGGKEQGAFLAWASLEQRVGVDTEMG